MYSFTVYRLPFAVYRLRFTVYRSSLPSNTVDGERQTVNG
jgi:hypothetical protein